MRRLIFAAVYLVLLVASHWVRDGDAPVTPPRSDERVARVSEYARGAKTGRTIQIGYRDVPPEDGADLLRIPIVVLHGNPGSSRRLLPLVRKLALHDRVIAPDLPGFGASTRVVADYSFEAQARAVVELLRQLGVERCHLVACGMSGGVAIELRNLAPREAASITLVSAVGVQEFEWLGDHTLDHLLFGLQYALIRAVQEFTPHFGLFDGFAFNTSYARTWLDSDQRPLRAMLQDYPGPMLIVHGTDDALVPAAAAREHARLVPQARVHWLGGGHDLVAHDPGGVARAVLAFLTEVEAGRAVTRDEVSAVERGRAMEPFDWRSSGVRGRAFVVTAMVLLAVATLASEDLACISAGLLAARGALGFLPATAGCLTGIVIGDMLLFLAGRWLGARALRHRPWKWFLSADRVERCEMLFRRRGAMLVLMARFLPGLRLPTYFAAGAVGMGLLRFTLYFIGAAVLWTPLLVGAAALVGDSLLIWADRAGEWGWLVAVGGLLVFWIAARVLLLASTWRGRRLLLGWWRRRVRWEFWPAWMVYPPVVVYILWLGLRNRCPTAFTAVNPAMPCGGLAGESKSEILNGFPSGAKGIARYCVLETLDDVATRMEALDDFMQREALPFPVVLKPDVGERGQGVAIVRDRVEAAHFLSRCRERVVVQEYVGGREFGLFYVRLPSEPRGRIISITAKRLTSVRGDGRSTLEELILADERAVCMAPFFLRRLAARLAEVPPEGAEERLTELGTHCRGAHFTDGYDEVWSAALEARLDALSRTFEGFFFGRYDVRTPSAEALRERAEFTVLELNGVTSEVTHIYDPRISLLQGWRALFGQWRLAFEIGMLNRARGFSPASVREILRAVSRHFAREKFEA